MNDLFDPPSLRHSGFTTDPIRVSVIIPLEYHRGMALECIRGWAQRQDYSREKYQILVGAPPSFDRTELHAIRTMLSPGDEIVLLDHAHDMTLIEDTAKHAGAALLLFSESHCVPQPDALSYLVSMADAHSEWSAFSAPTHAMTHNLLSRIEADIYSGDIQGKLFSHDWLRVLDQCFMIRREAYDAIGGFRGEFGHFAEWLFAATMKIQGLRLGTADRAVIHHAYIGDYAYLEAFTTDFAYGQIKYLNECGGESAAALFPAIPELDDYAQRSPHERNCIANYAMRDLVKTFCAALRRRLDGNKVGEVGEHLRWVYRTLRYGRRSPEQKLSTVRSDARRARIELEKATAKGNPEEVRVCFVEWFARLVKQGRLTYLNDLSHGKDQAPVARPINFPRSGSWNPETSYSLAKLFNVHDAEGTEYGTIRWTLPISQIILPLHAGSYRILLEWAPARSLNRSELLAVRLDGITLGATACQLEPTQLVLNVDIGQTGWHELSISVYPFQGLGDGRIFGLPIRHIHWLSLDARSQIAAAGSGESSYFLHVPKYAGTTIATAICNRFPASDIFSPYRGAYHADDLLSGHPHGTNPVKLYVGHFQWSLPELLRPTLCRCLRLFENRWTGWSLHFTTAYSTSKFIPDWISRPGSRQRSGLGKQCSAISCRMKAFRMARARNKIQRASKALVETAMRNLRSCRFVGLFEHLEDTINLLAIEMGFLPPETLSRLNPTEARPTVDCLSPALWQVVQDCFAAEFDLYEEARKLFCAHKSRIYQSLSGDGEEIDTARARQLIRRRYLERAYASIAIRLPCRNIRLERQ